MSIKVYQYVSSFLEENTWLVEDEATNEMLIVDPGVLNDAIKKKIESGAGLKYIVLTHSHVDHILALEAYKNEYPDAKLVAHFDEKEMLNNPKANGSGETLEKAIVLDADIYVTDNETMMLGKTEMRFIHTPGHTVGGMCILMDGQLFSGDTLFLRSVGRTDFYKGDWSALKSAIQEKLFALSDDTKVHCGHGPDTSIGYEKKYNPYV